MKIKKHEICQGNVQSKCHLVQLFLDIVADILHKKSKSLEKFFSSSGSTIWSILLKYQEIDVQIQTFTDEDETFYIDILLNGTNCPLLDYRY